MPTDLSTQFVPLLPAAAVAALSLLLLALLALGSRALLAKGVPPRWVAGLAGLRVAAVGLFALALLGPVVAYTRPAESVPGMLVLIDTSRSMATPANGGSRLDEIRRGLDGSGLVAALARDYPLSWFAFDRTAWPVEPKAVAALTADGPSTRAADALNAAWAAARNAGGDAPPPERVLIASDGHDGGGLVEAARSLGLAVDVLAPSSSPAAGGPRAEVADVQTARRVLLGAETHFLVTVRSEGPRGRAAEVQLVEGGKVVQSAPVTLAGGGAEQRLRLAHRPAAAGPAAYEVRVTGGGEPYRLGVDVLDGRYDVLVLEDTWRYEFKYFRRLLEDDPNFRLTAFLSRGGGAFAQFAEPDRRVKLLGFPQDASQLAGFDLFVLGDTDPRRWPRGLAAAIRSQVADEGKSLVVQAGPNLARWGDAPELLGLLPVELGRETASPKAGPVEVRVTAEGAASAFFGTPGGVPAGLPPLDQIYPPLRKKPAAAVLAESSTQANAYGPLIVMAEHTVGRGRVLYVGTDTLWKWHTLGIEDAEHRTPYAAFWQQSLRALARSRPAGAGPSLWVIPERTRAETGRPLRVRFEFDAPADTPRPATLRVAVQTPDGRRLPLTAAADGSGGWRAELEPPAAGGYRLTAAAEDGGRVVAEGEASFVAAASRAEEDGGTVDTAALARAAAATGGKVIDPGDPATWPTRVGQPPEWRPVRQSADLWNGGWLVTALVLVLGVDWLLRLLRGYV
jgi:hypothetical protein